MTQIVPHELLERRDKAIEAAQAAETPERIPALRKQMRGLVGELFAHGCAADIQALHYALTWRERDLTGNES